ncbi:cation transporter [Stygiobacter electus]|uniref:Cation transporter n=1 Tax=Stygiobacter electus TaxID=3032292 RepID=A0AAE3TC47_9BACT|nr:cation transporter [Stygiobacter electus]MDF1612043.1 cation transporter [Stygiobacter electus]
MQNSDRNSLLKLALALSIITIIYNIIEGVISIFFGLQDETLSLFGFGVDSFVEVISGIGIFHMVLKIKNNGNETRDEFERKALRITGTAFYILTVGLVISSFYNIWINHKPETTFWGIVISSISIITMTLLIYYKKKVGDALNSEAIIADANCTKTCLYLSFILLIASVGYTFTGIGYIDSVGSLGIAYFSFKEGRESFEKANSDKLCSCDNH